MVLISMGFLATYFMIMGALIDYFNLIYAKFVQALWTSNGMEKEHKRVKLTPGS